MPKATVEECQKISACELAEQGELSTRGERRVANATAVVTIRLPSGADQQQEISLVGLPAKFGGLQWLLVCPACFKSVRDLYLPPGRTVLACRRCYRLTYASQRERPPRSHAATQARLWAQIEKANKRREKACGVRIKTSTSDKQTKT